MVSLSPVFKNGHVCVGPFIYGGVVYFPLHSSTIQKFTLFHETWWFNTMWPRRKRGSTRIISMPTVQKCYIFRSLLERNWNIFKKNPNKSSQCIDQTLDNYDLDEWKSTQTQLNYLFFSSRRENWLRLNWTVNICDFAVVITYNMTNFILKWCHWGIGWKGNSLTLKFVIW